MLTFNKFRRKGDSEAFLEKQDIYHGWEETILVYKDDVFLCQINTAQAYCCGWNTLEKVRCWYFNEEETKTFWKEVNDYLNKIHATDFKVGELFHLNTEFVASAPFFKYSEVETVHSYRSKSEPHHSTILFKFKICSS